MRFTLALCCFICLCVSAQHKVAAQTSKVQTSETPAPLPYVSTGFQDLLVVDGVRSIAEQGYIDSATTSHELQEAVRSFLKAPGVETHEQAKNAWVKARAAYTQTEVFRFIYPEIADWEGHVNAWPIDEGLLDYIATGTAESEYSDVNIVKNTQVDINGVRIDAPRLDFHFITDVLHELDGLETNVARGFHAVEFLLWGQDLHQNEYKAGQRHYKEFDLTSCPTAAKICARRRELLGTTSVQLNRDLRLPAAWLARDGGAATRLMSKSPDLALQHIFNGTAHFIIAESAGERMRLAMEQGDPEEEHDCFSDQSHNSHWFNFLGVKNVLTGSYH